MGSAGQGWRSQTVVRGCLSVFTFQKLFTFARGIQLGSKSNQDVTYPTILYIG